MPAHIITHAQLLEATNCKRTGDLEKVLRQNGIKFLYGKGGLFTTLDALNAAMGLQSEPSKPAADIEIL